MPFIVHAQDELSFKPESKIKFQKKSKSTKKKNPFYFEYFESTFISSDKLYFSSAGANRSHSNLGVGVDGLWGEKHQWRVKAKAYNSFSENKSRHIWSSPWTIYSKKSQPS